MSLNVLLISDIAIKERTGLHNNVDPKLIYPEIKCAQDMYIEPILGSALFNKLQADVAAGTVLGDYKSLMDNYIADALIYYTMADMPVATSYQIWNKGVVRRSGNDTESVSRSELNDLSNSFRDKAEFYADRLRRFLRQYASPKYPEYLNPGGGYSDVKPLQETFTMPVYLGGENCDCNWGLDYPKH